MRGSSRHLVVAAGLLLASAASTRAAEIAIACGHQPLEVRLCQEAAEAWSAETGHTVRVVRAPEQSNERYFYYLDLLDRGDPGLDILQVDVIWPSSLAPYLRDLSQDIPAEAVAEHLPAIVANNTFGGRLVAMPWFTDAGLLYYREDLLDAAGLEVPATWAELAHTALIAVERAGGAEGDDELWGFVFQGNAYEGLTCNALEWIAAHGGGTILDETGAVTVNNPRAVLALAQAASWIGTVAPPRVTRFVEEDARAMFQRGDAVFMRNWPYAWALLNEGGSPVAGKVGVAPLPEGIGRGRRAACLGGWNLAVSEFSANPEVAADFVRYLTGAAEQRRRAVEGSFAPTIPALYDDPDVLAANPFFAELPPILGSAVARPAAVTGPDYPKVSALFWEAARDTLEGDGTALTNLAALEDRLELLKARAAW